MNALLKISTLMAAILLCLQFGCATSTPREPEPSPSAVLDLPDLDLVRLLRDATPPPPPENQRDRLLTYAYRTGDVEALFSALVSLVAEKRLPAGESGDLEHFFAAALQNRPGGLEELARREAAADGDVKTALASILRAASNFSSPAPSSPAAVDALWAEYRALGKEETLRAVVSVLKLSPSEDSEELVRHATLSLARNIPVHGNLSLLEESLRNSSGRQRVLLQLVLDLVRDHKDAADRHTRRGDNLHAEGKNGEAVEEYLAALGKYPAYHPAHTSLGRYYEKTGDIPKALWHSEQALLFAGDDPYVLTNLSRVLYRQRRYAEARRYGEQALGNNPADSGAYYMLGLILEAQQERKKAAAFFAKSLEIEPHGTCSGDARRHLAAMNAAVPVSATDLVLLLRQKKFSEIEQQLAGLLESGEKTRDGTSRLYDAYEEIATAPRSDAAYKARLKELEAWLAASPDSHFVYGCLGDFYLEYAFFSRGFGWATSVTAEGWKLLKERLLEARKHLEKAYELDPADPAPPAFLIRVAMGLSLGLDEVDKQFRRSTAADKTFCEVYFRKMDYLAPYWHGSAAEMLAFARESAANAPPGSSIPRVLTAAHWIVRDTLERGRQDIADYFKDPLIWAELKRAHEKILRAFPDSSKHRNWYAKDAYYAGDYETARTQFEIIGNEWHAGCWKTYNAFQEAKKKVFTQ